MTGPARRRATYEDVLRAPPNMVAEVIFGVLHTQPRPSLRHANASSHMGVLLGAPFRFGQGGPGGWVIYDEPEARILEVYRHGGSVWHRVGVHHGEVGVRAEPFDAVELALGLLWER